MEFRLLGPLEVRDANRVVAVGGPRARALLAILLLHANEVMPADDLVFELWTKPPDTAGNSLQAHISRLRKALGSARLVTQKPGYLLKLADGERDVERFEALVAEGRQALANQEPLRAGATLREALALWRGPALADLASEEFAGAEIRRLEEARLGAIEERIEADLATGRHAELAPELELLTVEYPLRERLRGQLMLSLYRCGRQADALEVYRETRRKLVDELGIEPSPALRRLETAILLQDSVLEPVVSPRPTSIRLEANTSASTRMVGREAEAAYLGQIFRSVAERRGCHLATVLGAPGIGKTRLAFEFTHSLPGTAVAVIGRCLANQEGAGLWPLAEILKQLAPGTNPNAIRHILDGHEQSDPIAERLAAAANVPASVQDAEDLSWAFRRLLEVLAQRRPHIIVIDDLQWADERLLDLVDFVTEWSRDAALMFVCLARPELLDRRPAWGTGKLNASVLTLDPLLTTDADHLLDQLVASSPIAAEDRREVLDIAAGNPLFMEQIVALTLERLPDGVALPPTIPAIIRARLALLSSDELHILSCAAVVGREFWLRAVSHLSGTGVREVVLAVLRRLMRKDFIEPDWTSVPGEEVFRFRHGLLRDVTYAAIPEIDRASLHEAFADWLESSPPAASLELDELIGHHLEQTYHLRRSEGSSVEREALARRAAGLLGAVARREVASTGLAARVATLRRAAALMPRREAAKADLLADIGADLQEMGQWEEATEHYAEALEIAKEVRDDGLRAYVSLRLSQCRLRTDAGIRMEDFIDEGVRVLARLEELRSADYSARVRATLGSAFIFEGKPERARTLLEQVLRETDGPSMRLVNVCKRLLAAAWLWGPVPTSRAVKLCEELLENNPPLRVAASAYRSLALLEAMQGNFSTARTLASRDRGILQDLGLLPAAAAATEVYGAVELLAGDPRRAEELLQPALATLVALSDAWYVGGVMSTLAEACYLQGKLGDAWELTEKLGQMEIRDISVTIRAGSVRSRVLAIEGDSAAARKEAARAIELAAHTEMPNDRAAALFACAEVLHRLGQLHKARSRTAEAIQLWERKGNVVSARRAKAITKGY